MTWIDWVVLLGTLLVIALYGHWRTRRDYDLAHYLHGDETIRWPTIALSAMAAQASAITLLSTPAQGFDPPKDTPPTLDLYLYAYANPTVYVDPTGHATEPTRVDKHRPRVLNPGEKAPPGWTVTAPDEDGIAALVGGWPRVSRYAVAGVETALWDLLGQTCGQPIYQLLGGASRERIRIYNTCAGYRYVRALPETAGLPEERRTKDVARRRDCLSTRTVRRSRHALARRAS